ncbi:tumor necrosis factor ligand superfamily member 11 isoform X1 [Osmerus eperlanus]|uniref:tumor necrosis factor ligand superfamily member 11 isoform X1 n=1 Tax=Osmerus eperlanus TaxID=29151 RepID=UPI002E125B23
MAANNDYRSYLRNPNDIEGGQPRFPHSQTSEPTYRPLLFGTLAVMGLLQVASSVAILLHLTGYLHEVDLSSVSHRPMEEVQTEPIIADALKDPRKGRRCKAQAKEGLPFAHLPIIPNKNSDTVKSDLHVRHLTATVVTIPDSKVHTAMIHWDQSQGNLERMNYHNGRLIVEKEGLYYIYAKTCFRYLKTEVPPVNMSNLQLMQYISHEKHTSQNVDPVQLMKTGSTVRWDDTEYNMYCAQQGLAMTLKQGDSLFVEVSNIRFLDPDSQGTYFGVMMLSNCEV